MLAKKMHSVRFALNGLKTAWQEETSFRLQVGAMLLVIVLGWAFDISKVEWLLVFIAVGFVLSAEVFNTALEELCDKFRAEHDPHIGKIKDLAAAAVLIASLVSLVIGVMVFFPHIALLT